MIRRRAGPFDCDRRRPVASFAAGIKADDKHASWLDRRRLKRKQRKPGRRLRLSQGRLRQIFQDAWTNVVARGLAMAAHDIDHSVLSPSPDAIRARSSIVT